MQSSLALSRSCAWEDSFGSSPPSCPLSALPSPFRTPTPPSRLSSATAQARLCGSGFSSGKVTQQCQLKALLTLPDPGCPMPHSHAQPCPAASPKGCETRGAGDGLPNRVRLSLHQQQKTRTCLQLTPGQALGQPPGAARLCSGGGVGYPGREPRSVLCPVPFLYSAFPRTLLRAVNAFLPFSSSPWNIDGIRNVPWPGFLPSWLATASSVLCLMSELNERARSFSLPNSESQLLGRKCTVLWLPEENLIKCLIALSIQIVLFLRNQILGKEKICQRSLTF